MSNPNDRPLTVGEFRAAWKAARQFAEEQGDMAGQGMCDFALATLEAEPTPACHCSPYADPVERDCPMHAQPSPQPGAPKGCPICRGAGVVDGRKCICKPGAPKGMVMPRVYDPDDCSKAVCSADDVRALLSGCNAAIHAAEIRSTLEDERIAAAERARIVEWLREKQAALNDDMANDESWTPYSDAADAIERGESGKGGA